MLSVAKCCEVATIVVVTVELHEPCWWYIVHQLVVHGGTLSQLHRHRLRSASSPSLVVRRTRLSTYFDRAFPVAASRVWNSLPHHVTSAQSLPVFCSRLKTHLFSRSFRWLYCCACEVTLVITDTLIAVFTYLLTYIVYRSVWVRLRPWSYNRQAQGTGGCGRVVSPSVLLHVAVAGLRSNVWSCCSGVEVLTLY